MILLTLQTISSSDAVVIGRHFFPEQLTEDQKQHGLLVESIPEEPVLLGNQYTVLHINPVTKEMWHEILTAPKTKEQLQAEEIEALKAKVELQQGALDDLIMNVIPSLLP
jgi:hypothetical protein